jgi:hypothetical protein
MKANTSRTRRKAGRMAFVALCCGGVLGTLPVAASAAKGPKPARTPVTAKIETTTVTVTVSATVTYNGAGRKN